MKYTPTIDEVKPAIYSVPSNFINIDALKNRTVLGGWTQDREDLKKNPNIPPQSLVSLNETVFIDGEELSVHDTRITAMNMAFRNYKDGQIYRGIFRINGFDYHDKRVKFTDRNDLAKLLTDKNGNVLAVVAGNLDDEYSSTIAIPAVDFLIHPPIHIKHYARKHFNLEAIIKGRPVLDKVPSDWIGQLVYLEGENPDAYKELDSSLNELRLNDKRYTNLMRVFGYAQGTEGTQEELDDIYNRNALITNPDSVGKALLMRGNPHQNDTPKEEIVAGIVVHHETPKYREDHKRWYSKTYICPANAFDYKP